MDIASSRRRSPTQRDPLRAALVLIAVLGLHLMLWRILREPVPVAPPQTVRVTVLRLSTPDAPSEHVAQARRTIVAPLPRERRTPAPTTASTPPAAVARSTDETLPIEITAAPSQAPASGAWPSLLDTPATRRAIREAARQPSLADRSAALTGEAQRSEQRLGNAIAGSAHGDCLKGEYAGGGMGLLSLPFWALGKLREQCGK